MANDLEKRAKEVIDSLDSNRDYLYFAHSVDTFNTPEEREFLDFLGRRFSDFEIYNPNQGENLKNYKLWKEKKGNGMDYYFEVVLPRMEGGVYLAYQDGMVGAGVFNEMEFLLKRDKPIWEIDRKKNVKNVDSLDYSRKLSIEDTRKRIY